MSKKTVTVLGIITLITCFILILIVAIGYYLYTSYFNTLGSFSPPLENVDFPSEQVEYPPDWPDELRFPKEFVLVDYSSGSVPDNSKDGWSTKLRYDGKPLEAVKEASSYMEDKGWTVLQNEKLDSGGYLLLLQNEQGSGVIVIDPDPGNSSQTIIITTIFQ